MVSDTCTIIGGRMLGRMWPSSTRASPLPRQPRRLDEARVAPHVDLGARDAGIERQVDDRGGDDDVDHLLPSAATMPIASTNSGKAMMVSASAADDAVGPAAEIAGGHARAARPARRTAITAAKAMPRSSRVATMTRLKMSRPSWSVPNQCAADGGFSAMAASLVQRIVGRDRRPEDRRDSRNSANSAEGDEP